jgi:hypothetical protein
MSDVKIEGAMSKYDLIYKLTDRVINSDFKSTKDIYKSFLRCYALVEKAETTNIETKEDIEKILIQLGLS